MSAPDLTKGVVRVPRWLRFSAKASPRDWLRLIALAAAAGAVVVAVLTVVSVEITEQPGFCRSCHIMEPYYQGWATSTHRMVPCIDCHYEPGIRSTVVGKLQGIRQVVVYFTGGAGTRPWAEIADASCLRSGCHQTRLLEGVVDFSGIKFDHAPHLTEMRRGKKLRCVSCHSQVVQGSHITVTTSTCIICHFKDRPAGDPIGGCLGCHHVPSDTIPLPGGLEYRHENYVSHGIPCVSCHATATAGDGFVPKSRCYVCHNLPDVERHIQDPEFIHRNHVTEHKVECTDCHEEITHGYESERRVAALDCRGCHAGMHQATVSLAQGDAAGVLGDSRPHVGPMLAARVECISCHVREVGSDTPLVGGTRVASNDACIRCHGRRVAGVLGRWNAFFARRIPEVDRAIRASRADAATLRRAREILDTVRLGRPVHNPSLGRDLLDAVERMARGEAAEAVRVGRPVGEREPEVGLDCSYCHLDEPQGTLRFRGLAFPHTPHVRRAGIGCNKCHEEAPTSFPEGAHGRARITEADCQRCHHWQTKRCEGCHGNGPSEPVDWNGAPFPHPAHVRRGVACISCHGRSDDPSSPGRMGVAVPPSQCASCHHKAGNTRACAACHMARLPETVSFRGTAVPHKKHVDLGLVCGDCHKSGPTGVALAPTCGTCHHGGGPGRPACAACHGAGPEREVATPWRPFSHARHAPTGLGCADCHPSGEPARVVKPDGAPCATCHDEAKTVVPVAVPAAPAAASETPAASAPAGGGT